MTGETGLAAASQNVRVETRDEPLAPLVWRGQILTILTLGIYRFWYRTNLRRWYWRNTSVAGDGFEYRGTPRELFIGFLIALALTLPLYFAGALAALLLASETAGNIVTALGVLALTILAQYGAYRSRRFRLTRTVWRGLRFNQTGSPWRYAMISLLWALAVLLSAGLLLPLFRRSLEAMKIRNTAFGSATGRFSAPAGRLMLRWLPVWLALLLLGAIVFYWFGIAVTTEEDSEEQTTAIGFAILFALAGLATLVALWPSYRAAEFRIFAAGTAIGPVTFSSDLPAGALYGLYIRFGLLVLALLALAGGAALIMLWPVLGAIQEHGLHGGIGFGVLAACAGLYLAIICLFMVLKELVLNKPFWRRAAGSVTVGGLEAVDAIAARPATDEAAVGEGLGDALDFGGV